MASDVKTRSKRQNARQDAPLEAPILDTSRVAPTVREELVHPDPAPLHEVPKDTTAEVTLARVEHLLGKGQFGAALAEAASFKPGDAALAGRYAFVAHEKIARAQLGIADRYFLRGDKAKARAFYEKALQPAAADPALLQIVDTASKAFDELAKQRGALIGGLLQDVKKGDFTRSCGRKKTLKDLTLLDVDLVRKRIFPDFRLEPLFGERPPIHPQPGYVDPLPVETDLVAFQPAVPGAVFRARTDAAINVDTALAPAAADTRIRASLAMPVVANVLAVKARLFALEQGLSVTGQADGVVPIFRYEHLRDKAKEMVAYIRSIEEKMLPIQFSLDDFAEATDAIRRPLATQQAELEAVNQRIAELTQALTAAAEVEKGLTQAADALDDAEDQCECDWFCWLVTIATGLFIYALTFAVVATITAFLPGLAILVAGVELALIVSILTYATFTCDNVGTIGRQVHQTLDGVRAGIAEGQAELSHALMTRDTLIASINGLTQQLEEAYQSNAARVLDAKTLDAIQSQYNNLRQSLLTRAQAVARLAQNAFNFERDSDVALIRDTYADPDRKGYTAAESLLHDLSGLDHIDLTGRTQKAMQLSYMVSLQKHHPVALLGLAATGKAYFTTSMEDFDRSYPGAYLQRIKEIRVEALIDGEIVPARGYISNDGISLVRFADSEGKRPIDNTRVFAEPDPDIAKLCYKRLQRRRQVDTMAFPEFTSYLHEDRMRHIQDRERNFFENIGLESGWTIELLPSQPFDLSKISDIRVWFQVEALFDENLKRILDQKRYKGRREMAAVPVGKTLRDRGEAPDFASELTFNTSRALFEVPAFEKTIVNAGMLVRLKEGREMGGEAEIELAYNGGGAVTLTTDDHGVVATADNHPAGDGLDDLAAAVHGKTVEATWTVRLADLPAGVSTNDVDELFLLLNCEYAAA
jgi:hypothetical protein